MILSQKIGAARGYGATFCKNRRRSSNLLEMLTLVSDMLELKASKEGDTKAVNIESELSSKRSFGDCYC